ncbi:hypothetical protein [uncultured Draconibacterium sp.]|uniref:hypothetical protein n=1 Tax=uncultured Draconibacterium sp. TaxID=1573823 RepID=UPI0029C60DB7|nr:hypothetical protein [uncultured Draconibacterium sp.]
MKTYLSFLIMFLLIAMAACVQDEITEELLSEDDLLKSHEIEEGKYSGILARAAEWYISLPEGWEDMDTRYMIFYAHGLQDPGEGPNLPSDTVSNRSIEDIITGMGLGYATTSYRDDGFIADEAVEDIRALHKKVCKVLKKMPPDISILGGPSEGGLVTALTLERYPKSFDGALSICGPIGDFFGQLQYNGNFHVLFNYFFGEDLATLGYSTGSPLGVGEEIMDQWRSGELPSAVQQLLYTDALQGSVKLLQLLNCAQVPADMTNPVAMGTAALQCLRYNIMITDDLIDRLDGIVPFNNMETDYSGSLNDEALNNNILRVNENSYLTAMMSIKKYETTGDIQIPFVTIHTTGDNVTPFWHDEIYRTKILSNGNGLLHTSLPVENYGHCTIEESDIVNGLGIVITKIQKMP